MALLNSTYMTQSASGSTNKGRNMVKFAVIVVVLIAVLGLTGFLVLKNTSLGDSSGIIKTKEVKNVKDLQKLNNEIGTLQKTVNDQTPPTNQIQ